MSKEISKSGCFARGTKILYYDGSVKLIEEVKIGDILMGNDNTPRTVLKCFQSKEDICEIQPLRGSAYVVNKAHKLILNSRSHFTKYRKDIIMNKSSNELLQLSFNMQKSFHSFRCSNITCWKDEDIDLEPYFLGLWLGDGTSSCLDITNIDKEVLDYCQSYADRTGLEFIKNSSKYGYSFRSKKIKHCFYKQHRVNWMRDEIKYMNLFNNKHIPLKYKTGSEQTRLELLAGIIDTDGSFDARNYGFDVIQKNKRLAEDIIFVARSLGYCARLSPCQKSCMYKGEKRVGTYYRMFIHGTHLDKIPTKIPRKQADNRERFKSHLTSSFSIEDKGRGECFGFRLDGNGFFIGGDFEVLKCY